jgi:uncharacterized protein
MARILFQTGGPWHPLRAQLPLIREWLGDGHEVVAAPGAEALDQLAGVDLFVAAGMVWPEMDKPLPEAAWTQAGEPPHPYVRPTADQKEAFRTYVASGRPVLAFHGGILCFEDWPEYGRLLGFRWHWGYTGHSKYGPFDVRVVPGSHPVVEGVGDFRVEDELYFNVVIPPEMPVRIHAKATFADWVEFPMVMTAEGPAGRIPGAGRTAYLANGHTVESLRPPAMRTLWRNTVAWLLGGA